MTKFVETLMIEIRYMNNKCKNHRIRTKKNIKHGYCVKYKKEVPLFCKCNEIEHKILQYSAVRRKTLQYSSKTRKIDGIKKKSAKLSYLERNRTSLFTDDLKHCILCGKKKDALHEVIFGCSRQISMKYGLVIPLCYECHQEMHINKLWQDDWKRKGQLAFIANYPDLDFLSIFHRNYL